MSDKEVGKLWKACVAVGWNSHNCHVRLLICKLIRERINYYRALAGDYRSNEYWIVPVLNEFDIFDIDPATCKELSE